MKFRKILSLFLCVAMLFCTFAEFAFAADEVAGEVTETAVTDPLADVTYDYELMNQARTEGVWGAPRTLNGNYYILFKDKVDTWEEAKAYCESLGGHLATIDSEEENKFIYSWLGDKEYKNAYFGLYQNEETGVWQWVTGEPLNYTNWAEKEPNDDHGGESYGMFYWKYLDGTWNDGNFGNGTKDDEKIFICEFENVVLGGHLTETVTWKVDFKKLDLVISGTGAMPDYASEALESRPWHVFGVQHGLINKVVVEDGITTVGARAFEGLYAVKEAIFADSVTTVNQETFEHCKELETVTLGDGIKILPYAMFKDCPLLKSVTFPANLERLYGYVFDGCSSLTDVQLPDTMLSIGNYAFRGCTGLKEFVIPCLMDSINTNVFVGCTALEAVTVLADTVKFADLTSIPKEVTIYGYIGSTAETYANQNGNNFVGTGLLDGEFGDGLTWEMDFVNRVLTISGNGAIPNYTNDTLTDRPWHFLKKAVIKKLVIEEGITAIGTSAFKQMKGLEEVVIADSVHMMKQQAFRMCQNLKKVTLGDNLSNLGTAAFYGCSSLTEINLPQRLYLIGDEAFAYCSGLTEIILPEYLSVVRRATFNGCTGLKMVISESRMTTYVLDSHLFPESTVLYGVENSQLHHYAERFEREFFALEFPEEVHECLYNMMVVDEQYAKGENTYAFSCVCGEASETDTFSTSCGTDLLWTLEDGELVIKGNGKMDDYAFGKAPWLLSNGYVEDFDDLSVGEITPKEFNENVNIKALYPFITTASPWASIVEEDGNRFLYRAKSESDRDALTLLDTTGWLNAGLFEISFDIRPESLARNSGILSLNRRELSDNEEMRILSVIDRYNGMNAITFGGADKGGSIILIDNIDLENPEWISFRVVVDPTTYDYEIWINGEKKLYTVTDAESASGHTVWICEDGQWDVADLDIINQFAMSPFTNVSGSISSIYMFHFNDMQCGLDNLVVRPCADITKVTVEGDVQSIGANAFVGCENLEAIDFCGRLVEIYDSANTIPEKAVIYGYKGSTAEEYANKYNRTFVEKELKEEDILVAEQYGPNLAWTVTVDGALIISGEGEMYDFSQTYRAPWWNKYSTFITSVVIEEGVTTVGDYTFQRHPNIRRVSLPNTLKTIGNSAFAVCASLEKMDIPASVQHIGSYVFYKNNAMTDVYFRSKDTVVIDSENTFAEGTTVHATAGYQAYNVAVKHGRKVADLVIVLGSGDCNETVRWEMLSNGTLFLSGEGAIPDYNQTNRAPWYKYAYKLTSVIMEDGITSIGAYTFQSHKVLSTVVLPEALEKIGVSAFAVCKTLYGMEIPETVTEIGSYAFYGNDAMRDIHIYSRKTRVCASVNTLPQDTVIYAPYLASAYNYSQMFDRTFEELVITLEIGVCGANVGWEMLSDGTLIISGEGDMTDYSQTNRAPWYNRYSGEIKTVIVGEGVTSIGDYAFQNHKNFIEGSIASTVTKIGKSSFANCKAMEVVALPEAVATIDTYAFYGCSALTDIYIDSADAEIADSNNTLPAQAIINAPANSTAQAYAEKWGRSFRAN